MSERVGPWPGAARARCSSARTSCSTTRVQRRDRPGHRRGGRADPARGGGPLHATLLNENRAGLDLVARACSSRRRSTAPRWSASSNAGRSGSAAPADETSNGHATEPDTRPRRLTQVVSRRRPGSQSPGVEPGSRTSATAAHRSVAVGSPTNDARTTPSASDHEHHRHRVDPVAPVEALRPTASTSWTATAVDSSGLGLATVARQASHVAEVNTATSHGASGRAKSARSTWVGTAQLGPWLGGAGRRDRSHHATPTATAATTTATTRASTAPSLADRPRPSPPRAALGRAPTRAPGAATSPAGRGTPIHVDRPRGRRTTSPGRRPAGRPTRAARGRRRPPPAASRTAR